LKHEFTFDLLTQTSAGTEAITVFEFIQDDDGNMLYGKPVYMYRFPNSK